MKKYLFILFILPLLTFGQSSQTFTTSGSFVVPLGVTSITVQAWGGGGCSGNNTGGWATGGGGGGAFTSGIISVTPGATMTVTVGAGGVYNNNDTSGGSSSVGLIVANGGSRGLIVGEQITPNRGLGGAASANPGGGVTSFLSYAGGNGGNAYVREDNGGGGGGGESASFAGIGINGSDGTSGGIGGAGGTGNSGGGDGGRGSDFDGSPTSANGSFPGGGGGGKVKINGSNTNGGNGQVIISWSCPTYSLTGVSVSPTIVCSGSTTTINLTGSAAGFPKGIYTVTYDAGSTTGLTAAMTVTTAGTGSFTSAVLSAAGSNIIKITNLASGTCSSVVSASNTATVVVNPIVKITLGATPTMVQGSATNLNLPYTLNNGEQSNVTFDAVAIAAGITGFQSTSIKGTTSGNIVLQLPYCLKAGTYSGTMNVNIYTPINCTSVNYPFSIIITSSLAPTGTASQSFCSGATVANLVPNPGGASSIKWYDAAIGGNLLTSGTALTTATHYYASQTQAGCESTARLDVTVTLSANMIVLSSAVGTDAQKTCIKTAITNITYTTTGATGIGTPTNLPSGVTAVWASNKITISGTPTVAGTFNYSIPLTGGCGSGGTATGTITVDSSNTWTGATSTSWFTSTNWSCGIVPGASSDVTIPNVTNKPIIDSGSTTAYAKTLTVSSGASLTVNSGNTLIVTDNVTNNSGTITFETSSSLVQTNSVLANTGSIIYKRDAGTPVTSNYTYWSSPVVSQTLNLSPYYAKGIFYSFDNSSEAWVAASIGTIMMPGQGYIAQGPVLAQIGLYNATFTGVPNNGNVQIAVPGGKKSVLIGNPYPSAVDATAFINANTAIDGTLYFWTHSTALQLASNIGNNADGTPKAGSGAYAYTQDDYALFNITGGTASAPNDPTKTKPSGFIAAGQSFFTTSSSAAGSVTFTNAMRVGGSNNSQFYKTKNLAKTTKAIEKDRVWLNLTNAQGAFKQTLLGYITDATNDYDSRYDGESFDSNEFVDFYSINQEMNLTIQGRAVPFDENDEVPLGYRTTIDGEFTINIDQTDGVLAQQPVYLEDKLTNALFNLQSGNYTFKTASGTFNDRFVLRFTNKTLGTNDLEMPLNTVLVSIKNKQIKINSFSETIANVAIYDLLGRQIYQKNKLNSNEFLISDLVSSHQTLIVKTSLQNGSTLTNKVIY